MKINGLGVGLWIAEKFDIVKDAYEIYQATQSNDALIDLEVVRSL
jgi:hypothetical protein